MEITECRICGNKELPSVLDLGSQAITSVFPRTREEVIPAVPLELVKCSEPAGCGLVQLRHTTDPALMYGTGYGYRSGIAKFMVDHLGGKVDLVRKMANPRSGDLVVDIGSNDATLLNAYPADGPEAPELVGIDPSGEKFLEFYPRRAQLIPELFSRQAFADRYGTRKAKVVTSLAMFYDLDSPTTFMQDVHDILADDGIWMIEQSYLPSMLETTGYDIICHEHLEYYSLRQIEWMAERAGLVVVKAEILPVWGGSLNVILAKRSAPYQVDEAGLARIRARESELGLDTMAPYQEFADRVGRYRDQLRDFLATSRKEGKLTLGYGASTKGNVILQYCGLTEEDLPCIGEMNPEKHGTFAPGTGIPIVSQEAAKARRPDQLLVLPWIHRDGFVERERDFVAGGGRLVFPMPQLSFVG
ncbi:class I SAM-dependent methyltransferase [Micromonospora sp. NPDC050686]|uniref:class I SAM-dependent methyltransferase n=1 Tax=Micromonospora sp. NPDC050686 TaxID=3154631 RepID=UPI0033E6B32C